MGAKHVTPEEIVKMISLYNKYGTYEAVGRELGRSGSTVSKYVQMKGVPHSIQIAVRELIKNSEDKLE